jgi:beta-xylosidase
MVWTTSWKGKTVGYAHSQDLIHWSKQTAIPVMAGEPASINCWAPEVFYNAPSEQFYVVWATTVPGRFPETDRSGDNGYNHRLYCFTTRDFGAISPTKLFYEPGFNAIDGAIVRDETRNRYALVVKNETRHPPAKNLFMTFAEKLTGPWTPPSEPFSGADWAEGPSIVRIGDAWYCYWDKYRRGCYGAAVSKDLERWTDVSDKVRFPPGTRHGTAFRAPQRVIDGLKALDP